MFRFVRTQGSNGPRVPNDQWLQEGRNKQKDCITRVRRVSFGIGTGSWQGEHKGEKIDAEVGWMVHDGRWIMDLQLVVIQSFFFA